MAACRPIWWPSAICVAAGHECEAVNLTRLRREDADGVYYPRARAMLMRLLWRLQADILHLHFGGDLTPRLLGLALFARSLPGGRRCLRFIRAAIQGRPRDRRRARARCAASC